MHEWRKAEKALYLPKGTPETVIVPRLNFFTVQGEGNPNDAFFAEYIGVLYALSYGVKMSPKRGAAPTGYFEYAIYPLEGVWDLSEEGRARYDGTLDKNALVFTLMIRQPDFVDAAFAAETVAWVRKKKPHRLLDAVRFESIEEGKCVQMLHAGSYDDEPPSFRAMEAYAAAQGLRRRSLTHREIYLTDARKTESAKLRTVLRFPVE